MRYRTQSAKTLDELKQAADAALPQLSSIAGFQLWYLDEIASEIVILIDAPSVDSANAIAAKALQVPFRVERRPGGIVPTAFRGGQVTSIPDAPWWCMTSFSAVHKTAKTPTGAAQTGMVTANHCYVRAAGRNQVMSLKDPADNVSYVMNVGAFVATRIVGTLSVDDIRFLYNNRVASSQFYFDNSGAVRTVTGTRNRASTTIASGTTAGSYVCHLGQASPVSTVLSQSCGEVVSRTASLNYDQNGNPVAPTNNGLTVVVRNTTSGVGTAAPTSGGTLKCYRGDSGGPVFAGTIAFGVVSSCTFTDLTETTAYELFYTSVDQFADIGVTILVN